MPSQSLNDNRSSGSGSWLPDSSVLADVHVARAAIVRPMQTLAFWTAIALPFLYVPLMLSGLTTTAELYTFFGLVALNIAALLAGHGYRDH